MFHKTRTQASQISMTSVVVAPCSEAQLVEITRRFKQLIRIERLTREAKAAFTG